MRSGPFASAWRKWDWAEKHRKLLEADYRQLAEAEADSTPLQFQQDEAEDKIENGRRHVFATVLLGSTVAKLSPGFPLILGDALHGYRGALDHLIWSLVRRHGASLSSTQARKVQFPMHNNAADFEAWKNRRTPRVPDEPHRAFLKRYQPYRRGEGPSAIRWLRRLSDADKHREIIPAVIAPQGVRVHAKALHPDVKLVGIQPLLTGPIELKPHTPIAKLHLVVPVTKIDELQVRVDTDFTLLPLLPRRAHPGGVITLISKIAREIIEGIEDLERAT